MVGGELRHLEEGVGTQCADQGCRDVEPYARIGQLQFVAGNPARQRAVGRHAVFGLCGEP